MHGSIKRVFASGTPPVMPDQREMASLLALTEAATARKVHWHEVADLVELAESASALAQGVATFYDQRELTIARSLSEEVTEQMIEAWVDLLSGIIGGDESRLVTVLDDEYPMNLRRIYNRPPFCSSGEPWSRATTDQSPL